MTKVVALGGGHGLAATLQAVRRYAEEVTAIVSVADDGGSSGRLRAAFGISPPGDLRRCLVALADPTSLWTSAFEHRFAAGELEGHALGNLVIAGLADATGDFSVALAEAGRLVGAVGRVLPATRYPVVLKAVVRAGDGTAGDPIEGQVAVAACGRIAGVSLVPADAEPVPEAIEALAEADQIVIGPGSLFTSLLAVTVVPAIRNALEVTPARKIYVCNLREQQPETSGYDVAAHVEALGAHGVRVDTVVSDPDGLQIGRLPDGITGVQAPVSRPDGMAHDPQKLADALENLVG
ncbi:MAG TPA: gluconeogenesis factor YvcK family protein [Acidimicrobiales bacterium]|nr:gluconeogenesis factor YvcK family protein [Acidimicrobiales bacterium]